jgi:hypothetical protein
MKFIYKEGTVAASGERQSPLLAPQPSYNLAEIKKLRK